MQDLHTFISGLPKCELHLHLEGTLTLSMAQSLAVRNNVPLPPSITSSSSTTGYTFHDLPTFLAVYYPAMSVLLTTQDFHDLTYAYLLKCKAQNVLHAEMFRRARAEGWSVTCHCDVDQEGSIEHIRQCLEEIGVDRIDHGTNVVEDEKLVELLKERGVGLTCCPLSNAVVSEDFKGKQMVELMREGVKVTVNSDDPAYFGGYMIENMVKIAEGTVLTRKELVQLQRNAFEIAWISQQKRQKFLNVLDNFERQNVA